MKILSTLKPDKSFTKKEMIVNTETGMIFVYDSGNKDGKCSLEISSILTTAYSENIYYEDFIATTIWNELLSEVNMSFK